MFWMFWNKNYPHEISEEKYRKDFDRRNGDLGRRLENDGWLPNPDEVIKILSSRRVRVYLGIDPTGPDIHLGHTIPLLFLKQLMLRGHRPVILIGDFTGRIGDPTGKTTMRRPLSPKQVKDNSKNYLKQIYKILPKRYFDVYYNADWLDKLSFKEVIKLASHVTVQQMIQRDMFQVRMNSGQPIGLHEFLYPLMQGYDSVFMRIDGEVGGNDQTFNMLVGRDLEKKLIGKDKLVFVTQLLVDATTGKKMSKSEGGLISISDSPNDMFGKIMSVPDGFIEGMFKLCTEKDTAWITDCANEIRSSPYEYKKKLAEEVVRMYHDDKSAEKAKAEFEKVFSKKEAPTDILEWSNKDSSVLIDVIVKSGMASSRSEAKRLFEQKAVSVNDEVLIDWSYKTNKGDIIKVGPRKFLKII